MSAPILDLTDRLPTKTQHQFLIDRTRFRLLCGGLGSGKTTAGAEAFLDAVIDNPGCDAMMVAPTEKTFERFMRPAWLRACPRELIVEHRVKESRYLLHGNRSVWYATAENPESLEGSNLAAFWGDEIRYWKHESWRNLVARLRDKRARSLQGIATSTPAMNWMEAEFNRGRRDRRVFTIATRENAHNLAPGYIENIEASYSPRLCEALLGGRFVVVDGQVYQAFSESRHLVDWTVDANLRTTVWMDFGVRHSSVLFAQHTGQYPRMIGNGRMIPPNSIVIFDELQPEEKPTERVVPMIVAALKRHKLPRIGAIYCDPAGRARDIASGVPSVHLLQAEFGRIVKFQTAPQFTWIPNGVAVVEGMLNPLRGDPTLYFHRGLGAERRAPGNDFGRGIVPTLRGLRYPESRTGQSSDHPLKDGYFEHCGDALRYGCVNSLLDGGHAGMQQVSLRMGG